LSGTLGEPTHLLQLTDGELVPVSPDAVRGGAE
jgi:hypothetical protein